MSKWPWPSSKDDYFIREPVVIVLPDGQEVSCPEGIPFEGFGTAPGVWGHFLSETHSDDAPDWTSLMTWNVSPEGPPPYVRLSS